MPTVRTAKHLLLESTTKSGTREVFCQFCTVKGMVVESEVLKAQSCALSKLSLPVHSNAPFTILKTLRFLSVRYSADFARSRRVAIAMGRCSFEYLLRSCIFKIFNFRFHYHPIQSNILA